MQNFDISVLCFISNEIQVNIGEGSHPENVKVYGPGVEKSGLKANEPTYFTVDCSEAGQGQCVHLLLLLLSCFF